MIHHASEKPVPQKILKHAQLIDACTYGWIGGVTRPPGPWAAAGERGLHVARDAGLRCVIRIDAAAWSSTPMPLEKLMARATSDGKLPDLCLKSSRGKWAYDLFSICRVHWGRLMLDPRASFSPARYVPPADLSLGLGVAAGLIDRLESLFGALVEANRRPPPVYIEGGADLFSACVREVAHRFGLRVYALENSWIPDWVLVSSDGVTGHRIDPHPTGHVQGGVTEELAGEMVELGRMAARSGRSTGFVPGKPPPYPSDPDTPVLLFLGQVPFDAAITDLNPDCLATEEVPALIGRLASENDGPVQVRFRRHPEGCPASRIDGTDEVVRATAFIDYHYVHDSIDLVFTGQQTLEEELRQLRERRYGAVVTVNSQAGWIAALTSKVFALGHSWYGLSQNVNGAVDLCRWIDNMEIEPAGTQQRHRETRWGVDTAMHVARYQRRKEELTEYILRSAL